MLYTLTAHELRLLHLRKKLMRYDHLHDCLMTYVCLSYVIIYSSVTLLLHIAARMFS